MNTSAVTFFIYISAGILVLFVALYLRGSYLLPGMVGGSIIGSDIEIQDTAQSMEKLAYFDLPDLDGNHKRSSDMLGEPTVIVFWTTWNSEASDQIKIIDDYISHRQTSDPVVHIVAISSQEERNVVSSFMKRGEYRVETLLDADGVATNMYGVTSVPTFFFVDRAGVVRTVHRGILSEKAMVDNIEHILRD